MSRLRWGARPRRGRCGRCGKGCRARSSRAWRFREGPFESAAIVPRLAWPDIHLQALSIELEQSIGRMDSRRAEFIGRRPKRVSERSISRRDTMKELKGTKTHDNLKA